MQTDPISYAGGANLYAYVANDPVNATDPLGLTKCAIDVGEGRSELVECGSGSPQPPRPPRGDLGEGGAGFIADWQGRNDPLNMLLGLTPAPRINEDPYWMARVLARAASAVGQTSAPPAWLPPSPSNVAPPVPEGIQGGPWTPAGPGQQPGTFYGPRQPTGGRMTLRWVPEGGPSGSIGYWKAKAPGDDYWQRFN